MPDEQAGSETEGGGLVIVRAVFIGMLVVIAGTIPRNLIFAANLRRHGQAEWQASSGPAAVIWHTGADASFWISSSAFVIVAAATVCAYVALARVTRKVAGTSTTPIAP